MASSDKPSHSDKSRHFYIENHVTSDFLLPHQFPFCFLAGVSTSPFFEHYPHPGHFLLNRRTPIVVVVLFVQLISLLDTMWQFDTKSMRRSPIPAHDLGNDSLSLLNVLDTHHLKAGSSLILDATAYSATSTGLAFSTLHRGSEEDIPSAHSTLSSHSFVVILGRSWPPRVLTVPWSIGIASSFFR